MFRFRDPMKIPAILLLVAVAGMRSAVGGDVIDDLWKLEEELPALKPRQAMMADSIRDLRARLKKLPASATKLERERMEAGLAEAEHGLALMLQQERDMRERQRRLLASPEYRLVEAVRKDKRRPSRNDVSGVWRSVVFFGEARGIGPGYVVRLEQRGETVTGQGYYVGCMGLGALFQVDGFHRADQLSVTFTESPERRLKYDFHFSAKRGEPCFEMPGEKCTFGIVAAPRPQ